MSRGYAKSRSSGIEWLGDVPDHWGLQRLGFALADAVAGGTPTTSREDYWAEEDECGMPWIAIADMSDGGIVEATAKAVTEPGIRDARLRPLPPGTIIYSMYASVGAVAVLGLEAVTNQAILGLLPRDHVNKPYLFWWLHALRRPVLALTRNNTQANLNAEIVRRFPILLPPEPEQQAISSFLDHETAHIDKLITKQESLVERLDEYRTALVTRTVTKGLPPRAAEAAGLDPATVLKDSGVEWLGEVPEHWEIGRLSDVADLTNGYPFDSEMFDPIEGMPLVRIRDLYTEETEVKWSGEIVSEALIDAGDILIGMDGDFNVSWWKNGVALLNQRLCCLRTDAAALLQRFLFYVLPYPLRALNDVTYSTTVKHLSSVDVLKFRVPLPPTAEQRAIVEHLDAATGRIGALRAKAELSVERLREYRSALISAAVTGKIDVRDEALSGVGGGV